MWDVRYLADDRLGGREVGTWGAHCAADYLAERFRGMGLRPAYHAFAESFTVRTGYRSGSHNLLETGERTFTPADGWTPFGFAATGMAEGPLLQVEAGALGDDFRVGLAHSGAQGKVVLVDPADDSDPHVMASAAASVGAVALLWNVGRDPLPDLEAETRPPVSIPAAAVSGDLAEALLDGAAPVSLMTHLERREAEARNVVAVLPGPAWPQGDVVVVGAHFDHLGHGGQGSLDPDGYGSVHNGADDNASGTAVLLEVAHRLSEGPELDRSVIFVAFTGEERGLWGSGRFVEEPPVPVERMTAMINMDMVGRLESGGLTIFGVGTAEEWPELLDRANGSLSEPVTFTGAPDGYGPSDHSSFYGRDIPVLHFFTNTHTDYHRPSDDVERIDGPGLSKVAALVSATVREVTDGQELTVIPGVGAPVAAASPDEEPQASRGYGAYLGTIPDMSGATESGVRLTGVREGSPAAAAGLEAGDVLVEMAGQPITDLYAFTYVLRDHKPGDTVEIHYLRNDERRVTTAELGRR